MGNAEDSPQQPVIPETPEVGPGPKSPPTEPYSDPGTVSRRSILPDWHETPERGSTWPFENPGRASQ